MAMASTSLAGVGTASVRHNPIRSLVERRGVRVSRAQRVAGVTTALSKNEDSKLRTGQMVRGQRFAVRCRAEKEKQNTLSNLDALLGIEPEPEKPPRVEVKAEAAPPPQEVKPTPVEKSNDDTSIDFSDRIIGSVCYFLPLMDGLKYSKFLLTQFPQFGYLLVPLAPVAKIYYSLGFLNIIVFFAMYFGVGQNRQLSKFLRYNAMQAIVLDILLILPDVLSSLFNGINGPPTGGAGLEAKILFDNTVFLFVYLSVAYASISSLLGKSAKLPLVGEAADMQSGGGMDDQ
uniref:Protein TIC 20 n=1 Tax=Pyramimonas obovata TaxID=1411642 RepID=A0A6T7UQR6_9CHLO|mmetsp:Transcript_14835/g.31862  ORF Transcript_14835/g.31862 Transcript_14835/m.31862 type:complete len:288 (+) Transcript_14835:131-994(+)